MHFISLSFLFVFLPAVLSIWIILTRKGLNSTALVFLLFASSYFYLGNRPLALLLVILSALLNFGIARVIEVNNGKRRQYLLFFAILSNLTFLGYFKYLTLLAQVTLLAFDIRIPLDQPEFPVGISFYTLSQIAYLCTLNRYASKKQKLIEYLSFVLFFPKILAGPIMYANEFFGQLGDSWKGHKFRLEDISIGLTLFCIGAFKKVVFAEPLSEIANTMFAGVGAGDTHITAFAACLGILSYTLQLYFDFSGYSDMALGLSRMFGFKLPQNFNSPLQASSLLGFWQGWHMTMTRFFMEFVYNPISIRLTRNELFRKSKKLRFFMVTVLMPTLITFVLSGLWHGSTINFLCFGLIHGICLSINHAWRAINLFRLPNILGWLLMLFTVMTSLIFVRAPDLLTALSYTHKCLSILDISNANFEAILSIVNLFKEIKSDISVHSALHLLMATAVVLLLPNTQWVLRKFSPALGFASKPSSVWILSKIIWRPTILWAFICALCTTFVVLFFKSQAFIYYSF